MNLPVFTVSSDKEGIKMEKKFSEIIADSLRFVLRKYILIFRIPVFGDRLLDKVMNSYCVNILWKGWVMLSLM